MVLEYNSHGLRSLAEGINASVADTARLWAFAAGGSFAKMIGIINDAVRGYIIDTHGPEAWNGVVDATGIDKSFVSACPYPDEVTYRALGTLAEQMKLDLQDILEDCGFYFCMVYVRKMGYERLLRCMGGNLIEFLQNLNIYHLHLSVSFKEMNPPYFNVDDVTSESLVFHYTSQRPGLTRFAMGLLRGAAKMLYDTDVDITILRLRGEEGGPVDADGPPDHDTFMIRFPHQASVLEQHSAASTCRLSLDPPTLFQLFPFHMVIDSECRLVQVGRALSRMYPRMKPGRPLAEFFACRHPYMPLSFEHILEQSDNLFVLRSRVNGMELKGQMQYLQMPTGHPDSTTRLDRLSLGLAAHEPMTPFVPASSAAAAVATLGAVAEEAGSAASLETVGGSGAQILDSQDLDSRILTPTRRGAHAATHPAETSAVSLAAGCPHMAAFVHSNASASSSSSLSRGVSGSVPGGPATAAVSAAAGYARSRQSSSSGGTLWCRTYQRLHPGVDVEPVVLFLGSPRIGNLEELRSYGLYVSDLPLFDQSREMVLLAEQRTAEAAQKETFERLSLQLEEERQRSEQLLYQMIPKHIADPLRRGQRVIAETYPEATILFSDVVNFTTIAAGCTAMEVCNMLDDLYNEFDALIDEYPAVYKVETIGDAYMLVANVTQPCLDHVDVVLDFALDMQTVCNRVTTNMGAPIQIRVGVHTGSVVGGVVGRRMPRFHLFGDAVNTASRMESHGLAGAVHISAASRSLITSPAKYLVTERGEISVKGKGIMETYLVSKADAPSAAHLRCIQATSTPPECVPLHHVAVHHVTLYQASRAGQSGVSSATSNVVLSGVTAALLHGGQGPGLTEGEEEARLQAARLQRTTDSSLELELGLGLGKPLASMAPIIPRVSPLRPDSNVLQQARQRTDQQQQQQQLLERQQQQQLLEQQQQQQQQQQQPLRMQLQLFPDHLLQALPKPLQPHRGMTRSYSSLDVADGLQKLTARGTLSAAVGSPRGAEEGSDAPLSPFGDEPTRTSASATNMGTSPATAAGSRRRMLLAARRPRQPSFYLRTQAAGVSVPQVELAGIEAILQQRMTHHHLADVAYSPTPSPPPLEPYRHMADRMLPEAVLEGDEAIQEAAERRDLFQQDSPQASQGPWLRDVLWLRQSAADPGTPQPQPLSLPEGLPEGLPEAVLLPYEDEFSNVRHRLTRWQEEYDELGEYWI